MEAGTIRRGQEGSRWINERPTGADVASWFKDNVELHDEGLDHEHYVQGLTLIPQTFKEKEVVGWDGDKPIIDERENIAYIPYAKVETRVKYFWDYMALMQSEWMGIIEAVAPVEQVKSLPPGFGYVTVRTADNKSVVYFTYSAQVTVYKRDTVEMRDIVNRRTGEVTRVREGEIVMRSAAGTKQVPSLGRFGADPNALMKAETGAVGRALGMLGMLVVPGSGVATAEDMQEALALEGGAVQAVPEQVAERGQAQAQAPVDEDEGLRTRVKVLIDDLGKLDSDRVTTFRAWANEKKVSALADATSPQLRGLITKLEKEIEEANKDAAEAEEK
jgi:hypothetical protein